MALNNIKIMYIKTSDELPLIDWLIDYMIAWFIRWLIDWLIDWSSNKESSGVPKILM